tara:strand:- start:107 stop:331 length:225 start_codon:yes stop_codon:yes gene_type:complete
MLLQVLENSANFIDLKVIIMSVFALAEAVVRLTPSEKDNSIVNKVVSVGTYLLDFIIPNRSKSGKKFRMKGKEE